MVPESLTGFRFVHQITKERSAIRPSERGGGVLADEMGMGKSLSTLALIAKTIEEGRKWAEDSRADDYSHSEVKHHTHATLVIVPSACAAYHLRPMQHKPLTEV